MKLRISDLKVTSFITAHGIKGGLESDLCGANSFNNCNSVDDCGSLINCMPIPSNGLADCSEQMICKNTNFCNYTFDDCP